MFKNREEAGLLLANKLKSYKETDAVVIGIPRGGVVVAKKIADVLKLPLHIVVIKKIGVPTSPELAIGAVGPKGVVTWDKDLIKRLQLSKLQLLELKLQKEKERKEREKALRQASGKHDLDIMGKTVILVDDGIATGATILTLEKFLKKEHVAKKVLAVPVISKDTFRDISRYFDKIVVLAVEENFYAVGQFYEEFPQVSDEEVLSLLSS